MSVLAVSLIRRDGGTQSRAELRSETVAEYGQAYLDGVTMPPVVVFFDGTAYWLADGFHRTAGAYTVGVLDIPADVRQGTRRDAILFSVGANDAHGLRRTNADKRRAVMTLLADEEWVMKSDRWIAEKCAVSHNLVTTMRPQLSSDDSSPESPRLGKDGKTRRMATPKAAAPAEPAKPEALPASDSVPSSESEHERRSAGVKALHENGLGTAEIARLSGLPKSTVSTIKTSLGISANCAGPKLWRDISHIAMTLEGGTQHVDKMVTLVREGQINATKEDIETCIKRIAKVTVSLRALTSALKESIR